LFERIKKFLFTKRSKTATPVDKGIIRTTPLPTNDAGLDDLFEDIPGEAEEVFPMTARMEKDSPPRGMSPPVPLSVTESARAWLKTSFLGRWFSEKKLISETGITTRQRIKRFDAMHNSQEGTDSTTTSGKVEKTEIKKDGSVKAGQKIGT